MEEEKLEKHEKMKRERRGGESQATGIYFRKGLLVDRILPAPRWTQGRQMP